MLQSPYCRDITFLKIEAASDAFTPRGSVICIEWKGGGDGGGVQGDGGVPEGLGQGSELSISTKGALLGLSRTRQWWVLEVLRTGAFAALRWYHTPTSWPSCHLPWADLEGCRQRLTCLSHCT